MKIYTIITGAGQFIDVYADSYTGRLRNDPFRQERFTFYEHLGCLHGRKVVFYAEGHQVVTLTEKECPLGMERAYGGYPWIQ